MMIRDFCVACQYRYLRKNSIADGLRSALVRRRAGTAAENLAVRSTLHSRRLPQIVSVTLYACVGEREPQCSFVNGKNGHEGASVAREFVTTRWSLILSAANLGSEEQRARDALAELCRIYWRPIFLFVRGTRLFD